MNFYSVTTELERRQITWTQASEAELKTVCLFHNDRSPSLYINTDKRVCNCKSCGWSGDFISFLAKKDDKLNAEVIHDLQKLYGVTDQKTLSPQRVAKAHANIWKAKNLIHELKRRAINDDDIKKNKLGVERNRVTIPIFDENGFCVNIRKYLPGAPGDKKFRDERGCGSIPRLYPVEQLRFPKLILCGGEIKAAATAKYVNAKGIGAVSATGGEGRWSVELSEQLNGKEKVWIAYDIDATGRSAANTIAHQLAAYVDWLGIIHLPVDAKKYPNAGIDDFLAQGGVLTPLLEGCEKYVPSEHKQRQFEDDPVEAFSSLRTVIHSDNLGSRVSVDLVVSSMDLMPYAVPKNIRVNCQKNVDWCQICPMFALKSEEMVVELQRESPHVLLMLDVNSTNLPENLKASCGIPSLCKVCTFNVLDFQHAEDTRVSENLDVAKRAEDKAMVPAVIVTDKLDMNEPYTATGRLYPNPKNNQSILLISKAEKKQDSLSTFDVEETQELRAFRPKEWSKEAIGEKLDELYEDLEANVTRIYRRRQMHLMMDLAYHSPLFLEVSGAKVKGWAEVLIIGDTSQGKTETAQNLQQHYGLGGWLSCKSASTAGIIGGVQQISKRWFVTWGAMPSQDRRLLVLEELKGLEPEHIAKLTDTRSSGIAEIVKIERRRTFARVRLIALSNPRFDRSISTYNSGVEVIRELIGSLEDVRRFDGFYLAAKEELDIEKVLRTQKSVAHNFPKELCHDAVLWAWTVPNTRFENEDHLLNKSIEFGHEYSDNVPIYDRGSGRFKIGRLAAALAARTYSCEDPKELLIRNCHIDYVCDLLHSVYRTEAFGYDMYSRTQKELEVLVDEERILRMFNGLANPLSLAKAILSENKIDEPLMRLHGGMESDEALRTFSFLLRSHCLRRGDKGIYYKTSPFIKFLKGALANHEIIDRPDYIDAAEPSDGPNL